MRKMEETSEITRNKNTIPEVKNLQMTFRAN